MSSYAERVRDQFPGGSIHSARLVESPDGDTLRVLVNYGIGGIKVFTGVPVPDQHIDGVEDETTDERYDSMTVDELKQAAKEAGVEYYWTKNRDTLLSELRAKHEE